MLVDKAAARGSERAEIGIEGRLNCARRNGDAVLVGTGCNAKDLEFEVSGVVGLARPDLRSEDRIEVLTLSEQRDVLQEETVGAFGWLPPTSPGC